MMETEQIPLDARVALLEAENSTLKAENLELKKEAVERNQTLNLDHAAVDTEEAEPPEGVLGTPASEAPPLAALPPSALSATAGVVALSTAAPLSPTGRRGAMHDDVAEADAPEDSNWISHTLGQDLCVISDFLSESIGGSAASKDGVKIEKIRAAHALPAKLKLLLLYFSARWCPLCVEFDAVIRDVYSSLKALPESEDVELVWVSADVCEGTYRAHLQSLGTILAVAWEPEHLDEIMAKFSVLGVPTLLVLDADTGSILSSTGRQDLLERTARCVETQRFSEAWEPHIRGFNVVEAKGGDSFTRQSSFLPSPHKAPARQSGLSVPHEDKRHSSEDKRQSQEAHHGHGRLHDHVQEVPKGPSVLYAYWQGLLNEHREKVAERDATAFRAQASLHRTRASLNSPRTDAAGLALKVTAPG